MLNYWDALGVNELAYIIPDTQSRDGVVNPLIPVAHHICQIRPTFLIHLGDHWDFPSLSQYDKGKKSHRSRTYHSDVVAGNKSMAEFWEIILKHWPRFHSECQSVILKGNHEQRLDRAKEYGPDELVSLMDLYPPDYTNWHQVIPFLRVFEWNGIEFCHYFQNSGGPRPIGTARQLLLKSHKSRIAGHKQGFDYEEMPSGSNSMIQAMIVGSCYYHDEEYKAHTQNHFRGTVVLKSFENGVFDFSRYSLSALAAKFGRV